MRAVIQRVIKSSVEVDRLIVGEIDCGLLILLGVAHQDRPEDGRYLADKIAGLRIFPDGDGKMNRSLLDVGGSALVVSQFTLYGDCRKGKRPSFSAAASPALAQALYEQFIEELRARGISVSQGVFQADMKVSLINDGPVTLILESRS